MKITLEEQDKTVVIETNDVNTYDILNNLMLPALLAMGHHQDNIDGFIADYVDSLSDDTIGEEGVDL